MIITTRHLAFAIVLVGCGHEFTRQTPFCYARLDKTACECFSTDQNAVLSASDFMRIDLCSEATLAPLGACCTAFDLNHEATNCDCFPLRCVHYDNGDCACGDVEVDVEAGGHDIGAGTCTPAGTVTCCLENDNSGCACETPIDPTIPCSHGSIAQSSNSHEVAGCRAFDLELCGTSQEVGACDALH